MPSQRRVRLLFYVVLAAVITLLFFTSQLRQTQRPDTRSIQDFYHKTVNAMDKARGGGGGGGGQGKEQQPMAKPHDHDADGDIDEDDERMAKEMADRLKAAEQRAKDNANAKAPNKPDVPSNIVGVGSSASGQKKKGDAKSDDEPVHESEEDHAVETELNSILKKSAVIIFSKSYCPYSKRAKGVLLEKYLIDPAPYVVELDQHPMGQQIQARLGEMTARRTVPNIMINGKSIGGGDDIAALDKEKTLADKIKSVGGKRIEVTERFVEDTTKAG
ncbi:thioredoxin-like protein [Diplogelasinospora grovesii]|uniref:Thioredoxin-like protein n=1 Tax=Diplogelasinospora grovesii TaxID=303347 RepID=A0AAN6N0T0_9PEZI|nr:thioredoxin-like protein [Diplogelasinospora grovesii]